MEDVLKYQRLQGAVEKIVGKDRISVCVLEGNSLIVGTERGNIHVIALTGLHIQRYAAHPGKAIRALSVIYDGSFTIYSAAEDDDTVLCCTSGGEELRTTPIRFSQPISCIAIDYTSSVYKKDGAFVVGTESGRLIQYRPSYVFGKKEKIVEEGKGGPVRALSWQQNLVAWADAEAVYLIDISTHSAVGRFPTPCGSGDRDMYPVTLCWTDKDQLILGWAFSVVVLKIKSTVEEGLVSVGANLVMKMAHSWETDCVVCGVHAFDRDHLVYLGYSTAADDANGGFREEDEENPEDSEAAGVDPTGSNMIEPEVIVARIATGEIVSADVLPVKGPLDISQGPFQFALLSTHDQLSRRAAQSAGDEPPYRQWQLHNYSDIRGGDQGKAPILFIVAPTDVVVGSVRDVNDRVRAALDKADLKLAVEIGQFDRHSLRVYNFADLLDGYISQLLERGDITLAAQEVARLVGLDAILWEIWVYRFMKLKVLDQLCLVMPTSRPRLEQYLYEEVLDNLTLEHPQKLLPTLQMWTKPSNQTSTPLFDRNGFIAKLERILRNLRSSISGQSIAQLLEERKREDQEAAEDTSEGTSPRQKKVLQVDTLSNYQFQNEMLELKRRRKDDRRAARHYFASLAHLHLMNRDYEKALNCYLHRLPRTLATNLLAVPGKGDAWSSNSPAVPLNRSKSVSTTTASQAAASLLSTGALGNDETEEDFDLESDNEQEENFGNDRGDQDEGRMLQNRRERRSLVEDGIAEAVGRSLLSAGDKSPPSQAQLHSEHRHVFDLIEHENLFHNIANKVRYLVRLSRPLCQRLLLNHLDKLPIGSVAAQLQSDKELLRWYLNALFSDVTTRDTYRTKEFAQLHLRQLQLLIEAQAHFVLSSLLQRRQEQLQQQFSSSTSSTLPHESTSGVVLPPVRRLSEKDSELMVFLKEGWIPSAICLQEIDSFLNHVAPGLLTDVQLSDDVPPSQLLCEEKVFLLAMQGEKTAALRLLLEQADVDRVLQFLTFHGHGHAARYSTYTGSHPSELDTNTSLHVSDESPEQYTKQQQLLAQQQEGQQLWEEVIRRSFDSPRFLQDLLARLGDAGMDGTLLLKRLSEHVEHVPQLKTKLYEVVSDYRTMETLDVTCRALQQQEALALLSQKNRRQRRAVKIEGRAGMAQRCMVCLRPLGTDASPPALAQAMQLVDEKNHADLQLPTRASAIAVCGGGLSGYGHSSAQGANSHALLYFSSKSAVHKVCFDAIVKGEMELKRVSEESKEVFGSTATIATMEKRGQVARNTHQTLHR